jgi:branched-chain amino acid transport system ATP-binding protein
MATESTRTQTAGAALETNELTKKFGALTAVDHVDLSIPAGELRSVIGPNGAGKTTLFNLISGEMTPTEGEVVFQGEDITALPPNERIHKGMARSFQITNIFNGLSVRENVRLAAQATEYDSIGPGSTLATPTEDFPDINAKTDRVLERIGLDHLRDDIASSMAYGDQRRLEVGMVLATDPDLVLLDEPTAGMSGDEVDEAIDLIDDVLAEQTLMLVEHDIDLVMDISDMITVLHQGSVIADGTPEEISNDDEVQRAYLGGHA